MNPIYLFNLSSALLFFSTFLPYLLFFFPGWKCRRYTDQEEKEREEEGRKAKNVRRICQGKSNTLDHF